MNKTKAKKMAFENQTATYGDLLKMLDGVDMSKPSVVNPNIPKAIVIDIMRNGWEGKDLSAVIDTKFINHRGLFKLNVDGINMMNIIRECL